MPQFGGDTSCTGINSYPNHGIFCVLVSPPSAQASLVTSPRNGSPVTLVSGNTDSPRGGWGAAPGLCAGQPRWSGCAPRCVQAPSPTPLILLDTYPKQEGCAHGSLCQLTSLRRWKRCCSGQAGILPLGADCCLANSALLLLFWLLFSPPSTPSTEHCSCPLSSGCGQFLKGSARVSQQPAHLTQTIYSEERREQRPPDAHSSRFSGRCSFP